MGGQKRSGRDRLSWGPLVSPAGGKQMDEILAKFGITRAQTALYKRLAAIPEREREAIIIGRWRETRGGKGAP